MKRSLILAGGGAKIGWQAGVLQILFDEAGLRFDHIDATSGGMYNLGMLLSGKTATQIAEAWGTISPLKFLSIHAPWRYLMPWTLPSLVTQEGVRKRVIPAWGIDFDKIKACTEVYGHPVVGTFNVTDFDAKRLKVFSNNQIDEDRFVAVDAVPGLVPPVSKDGTLYTDAMFIQDQNLSEAVRRGADEIWVIWTVENQPRWKNGFWNHYAHIFEITANAGYQRELEQIEKINARVHANLAAPDQKHITVYDIRPDYLLPVGYMFWLRKKDMQRVIEMGRQYAREYLIGKGFLEPQGQPSGGKGVRFTETMSGYFSPGESDYHKGRERGENAGNRLEFTVTISISDLDRFLADPNHPGVAQGVVRSPMFGGACHITDGKFNLFTTDEANVRRMTYELEFQPASPKRLVLKGFKTIRDDPGADLWADTTTLMTQVVEADGGGLVGAGVLQISVPQFLRQLMTFRATGTSTAVEATETLARFGKFFMGGLWEVYGQHYFTRAS